MAIIVRLDDLLHARRMTLTELAARVDITLANLSILKTGKARAIRFSTLEAICTALDCQPATCSPSTPRNLPRTDRYTPSPACSPPIRDATKACARSTSGACACSTG